MYQTWWIDIKNYFDFFVMPPPQKPLLQQWKVQVYETIYYCADGGEKIAHKRDPEPTNAFGYPLYKEQQNSLHWKVLV